MGVFIDDERAHGGLCGIEGAARGRRRRRGGGGEHMYGAREVTGTASVDRFGLCQVPNPGPRIRHGPIFPESIWGGKVPYMVCKVFHMDQ